MDWISILSGFGAVAIVGMTGVGGGSASHHQADHVQWRLTAVLLAGSIPA
jgi:hypothetical protein